MVGLWWTGVFFLIFFIAGEGCISKMIKMLQEFVSTHVSVVRYHVEEASCKTSKSTLMMKKQTKNFSDEVYCNPLDLGI